MRHDHILMRVSDLTKTTSFFTDVLGLVEGFRPPFPFPGAWLYADNKPLIHLVQNYNSGTAQNNYLGQHSSSSKRDIVDHIAFQGDDYTSLLLHLKQHSISYFERTVPASHEHQVFLTGPEGLVLEILFNQDKSAIAG